MRCALDCDLRNPLHHAEPCTSFSQRSNTLIGYFCQLPSSLSAPNVASDAVEVDLGAQDHRQAGAARTTFSSNVRNVGRLV